MVYKVITYRDEDDDWQVIDDFTMRSDWERISQKIDELIDNRLNLG